MLNEFICRFEPNWEKNNLTQLFIQQVINAYEKLYKTFTHQIIYTQEQQVPAPTHIYPPAPPAPTSPMSLLLGSSNPNPSHWPLSFTLDPPPIIIRPVNSIHVLWTLSTFPNAHHSPNPTNPGGGLKFVNLHNLNFEWLTFKKIRSLLCLRSRNKINCNQMVAKLYPMSFENINMFIPLLLINGQSSSIR